MKILYSEYEVRGDYAFIVRWNYDTIIFDCYNDEWRDAGMERVANFNMLDTIDPIDLTMAGSYINIFEDRIKFPPNIRREFLKLAFERDIKKNP